MSHYNIDYSKITDPAEKQAKAIQDIKDYIGIPFYKKICKAVHGDQAITRHQFVFELSMFVGIEGYPAEAWADELGLAPYSDELVKTSTDTGPILAETACKAAPIG